MSPLGENDMFAIGEYGPPRRDIVLLFFDGGVNNADLQFDVNGFPAPNLLSTDAAVAPRPTFISSPPNATKRS